MTAKYTFCHQCYYNNRSPAICEDCHNGSEFDPADEDSDFAPSRTKPIKMFKKAPKEPQ